MLLCNTDETEETDANCNFLMQTLLTFPMLYIIYLTIELFLFMLFPA